MPVSVSLRFIWCLLFRLSKWRILFVICYVISLNCTITKVKLTFLPDHEIRTLSYQYHDIPLTFPLSILYYVYILQEMERLHEKLIQFCQKRLFHLCLYLYCHYFAGSSMPVPCLPRFWSIWAEAGTGWNPRLRLQHVRRTGSSGILDFPYHQKSLQWPGFYFDLLW